MFKLNSYSAFLIISPEEAGKINARKAVDEQNQKAEEKIMLNRTKLKCLKSELRHPEQEGLKCSVTLGKSAF